MAPHEVLPEISIKALKAIQVQPDALGLKGGGNIYVPPHAAVVVALARRPI
jgi:hypothetical protein